MLLLGGLGKRCRASAWPGVKSPRDSQEKQLLSIRTRLPCYPAKAEMYEGEMPCPLGRGAWKGREPCVFLGKPSSQLRSHLPYLLPFQLDPVLYNSREAEFDYGSAEYMKGVPSQPPVNNSNTIYHSVQISYVYTVILCCCY